MFTGLIEATGRVDAVRPAAAGRTLHVVTPIARELSLGESIAVNGVCLTVVGRDDAQFVVEVSPETLRVTTVGGWTAGRLVNLERSMSAGARFGGHFVQGHVDAVGRVTACRPDGEFRWLDIDTPEALAPFFIPRGSIAVDGISLTIARLEGTRVGMQIVPFTLEHTALREARIGDAVNIEADMIGKYVARQLELSGDSARPLAAPAGDPR
jgi:riboflavin synthase